MKNSNNSASAHERLGFIGLGNMGGGIALRLVHAGYPLTVLDLDKDKMSPLIKAGAATGDGLLAKYGGGVSRDSDFRRLTPRTDARTGNGCQRRRLLSGQAAAR